MAKLVASSRRSEHDVAGIKSRFVAQSGLFPLESSRCCSSPSIAQTCQLLPLAPMRRIYVQILLPRSPVLGMFLTIKETRRKPEDMPLSCRLAWFPWERDLVLYMAGPRGPMVASGRAGWTNRQPGDPPPQIVPTPIWQRLRAPCRQFTQPQTLPTPHIAWIKPSCGAWPRHGRVGLERVLQSC